MSKHAEDETDAACTESTGLQPVQSCPLCPPPESWMILLLLLCVIVSAIDVWGRDSAAPDCPALGWISLLFSKWLLSEVFLPAASETEGFSWSILNVHINNKSDSLSGSMITHSCYVIPAVITPYNAPPPLHTGHHLSPAPLYIPPGPLTTFLSTLLRPLAPCVF